MLALLGPLLSLLGLETAAITAQVRRQAIVWGLIGVLGIVFVAFLLVAANTALGDVVGPVVAPLLIALGAAAIALVIYLVAQIRNGIIARREAERRHSAEVAATVTTAALTALPLLMRSSLVRMIGIPLGLAIAAAVLLRKSPKEPHD